MEIIKLNPKKIEKRKLKTVADLLKQGKVIIFPTDTVYGILADTRNKKAVEKIYKIKNRPPRKPLSVFADNLKIAKKMVKINRRQGEKLKKIWPGKITAILNKKKSKTEIHGTDKKTIAIRIPNYAPLNFLLKEINFPLAQTSVNISGKPPLNNIKKIIKEFENKSCKPDLIVDIGNLGKGKPSLILDLTTPHPKIIRTCFAESCSFVKAQE